MTSARPVFTLKIRPEVGIDAARALKNALRRLLRDHGLRCLEIRQEPAPGAELAHTAQTPAPKPAATLGRKTRPTSRTSKENANDPH